VESEAILRKVSQLGFGHVQGYLLGRPQPLSLLNPPPELEQPVLAVAH
jgi:EAL domain-containing protein (putative c-di-GMP-specific phosphodiesterase class I)